MNKQFDIVVFGYPLQSAIFAYLATRYGLQVIDLQESGINNGLWNKNFILFKYVPLIKPIARHKQAYLIRILKKIASHLLISTEIEEYKKLSPFSVFGIYIQNLLSNRHVRLSKVPSLNRIYKLNYQSYKISKNRLSKTLFKSVESKKFIQFNSQNANIDTKNEKFHINLGEVTVKAKSILSFTQEKAIDPQNDDTFFISYPNSILKLEKSLIWEEKNTSIKVIPWFEWVHFEINSSMLKEKTINEAINQINIYFPSIILESHNVLKWGIQEKPQTKPTNITLKSGAKEFHIKSKSLADYFIHTENLISKISKSQKTRHNETVLVGSDFKIPYHPLRIMEYCDEKYDEAKHILQSPQYFKKLFYRYGTEIDKVTYQAYEFWNQTKDIKKTWLLAEIWYVINYEQCISPQEYINEHTEEWMNSENKDAEYIKNAFEELLKES